MSAPELDYMTEERIRGAAREMYEALRRIAEGQMMNPNNDYTHAQTVLTYQEAARAALRKGGLIP